MGRAREVTPFAFVDALWLLWRAVVALVEALLLGAPYATALGDFAQWLAAHLSDKSLSKLVGLPIAVALGATMMVRSHLRA